MMVEGVLLTHGQMGGHMGWNVTSVLLFWNIGHVGHPELVGGCSKRFTVHVCLPHMCVLVVYVGIQYILYVLYVVFLFVL